MRPGGPRGFGRSSCLVEGVLTQVGGHGREARGDRFRCGARLGGAAYEGRHAPLFVPFKRAGREGRGGDQPRRNSSGPARLCDDVGARRCAALRRGGRVHGMERGVAAGRSSDVPKSPLGLPAQALAAELP